MERVEHGPRAQTLAVVAEDLSRALRSVDDNDGNIAQLYLIHISISLRPLPVLLCCIDPDGFQIPNDGKPSRAFESFYPGIETDYFVDQEIEQRHQKH